MTDLSNDNEDLMSTEIYVLSSVTIIKFYYIVGSLSAKKWEKCYFPDKSTKLAGMVGKGLGSNIFNGSKMAFHYFVFCAPFSKWRLFALSRAILSP